MEMPKTRESSTRVEVSGWDACEDFFVEKSFLSNDDDGIQRVVLLTPLEVGSLVFVRCNNGVSTLRSVPVTYQVACISENGTRAGREVSLRPIHPRQTQAVECSVCTMVEARPN
jgi:hypothetical protein